MFLNTLTHNHVLYPDMGINTYSPTRLLRLYYPTAKSMYTSIDYYPKLYFFMPMRTFTLTLPTVLTRHVISFPCIPWPFSFSSPFFYLFFLLLLLSPFSSENTPAHLQHPVSSSSRNSHLQQHLTASTHRRRSLPQQTHLTAAASRGTGLLPPQLTPAAAGGSRNLHLQQHPTASTHNSRGTEQRQCTAATAYTRSSSPL